MVTNVLIVSTCSDPLSNLEFVKPLSALLERHGHVVKEIHYRDVNSQNLARADKILISGTSLKDFEYLKDIDRFEWILSTRVPILGICAGCHVLGVAMKETLEETLLIGKYLVKKTNAVKTARLPLRSSAFEAYFLTSRFVKHPKHFDTSATVNDMPVIIEHRTLPLVGCLFHPEVLNPDLIMTFIEQ